MRSTRANSICALAVLVGLIELAHASEPPGAWEDLGLGTPTSELVLRGDCRVLIVGDSISNRNTDATTNNRQSSLYWGMIRRWRPEYWAGLVIPTNVRPGNIHLRVVGDTFADVRIRNLQPGDENRIFSYGYQRFTSSSTLDILFQENDTPSGTTLLRTVLLEDDAWRSFPLWGSTPNGVASRGSHDNRRNEWLHTELEVDLVYLRTPQTIQSLVLESGRQPGELVQVGPLSLAGELGVVGLPVPTIPPGLGQPRIGLLAGGELYDETMQPDQLIWLTTWFRSADRTGLSLNTLAVGGAKVRDHLSDGPYADDDRLREYFAATGDPNLILIMLGANDGTFTDQWRDEMVELIDRLERLSVANGVLPRFLLVSPYGTRFSISHESALEAAEILESIARAGTGVVAEDRIAYCGLPVLLGGPIDQRLMHDAIHPNRRGANVLAELIWSQVSRCRADVTGSTDPDEPMFGVPDGVIDGADFFFYLDLFAARDDDADLSGPELGVPDGVIDSTDFFFFLELFSSQCE